MTRVVSLKSETMLDDLKRPYRTTGLAHLKRISFLSGNNGVFEMGEAFRFRLDWSAKRAFDGMQLRIVIFTLSQIAVGVCFTDSFSVKEGENSEVFSLDISHLMPGKYCLELLMVELDDNKSQVKHDVLHKDAVVFEVDISGEQSVYKFANRDWGHYVLPGIKHE